MGVVEVPIGYDRLQAQIVSDICKSEGIRNELVVFDETRAEMGAAARIPNRLVVDEADVEAVQRIVADLNTDTAT